MSKLNIFLFIAFILFAVGCISAQSTSEIPTYSQSSNITLSVPCLFADTVCPATTLCNATIINPNSLTIENNEPMTKNNVVYEINLTETQTSELGQYELTVACCAGTTCRSRFLSFLITPSGASPISSGQGTIILSVLGIMLFIAIIFFVVAFSYENVVLKTAGFAGGAIMIFIMILYSVLIINEVIASSPTLLTGYDTFIFVIRGIGTILVLGLMVVLFLVFLKAWKVKRGMID